MNALKTILTTSLPGSLILPPPAANEERPSSSFAPGGYKMRDPRNEVAILKLPKFRRGRATPLYGLIYITCDHKGYGFSAVLVIKREWF